LNLPKTFVAQPKNTLSSSPGFFPRAAWIFPRNALNFAMQYIPSKSFEMLCGLVSKADRRPFLSSPRNGYSVSVFIYSVFFCGAKCSILRGASGESIRSSNTLPFCLFQVSDPTAEPERRPSTADPNQMTSVETGGGATIQRGTSTVWQKTHHPHGHGRNVSILSFGKHKG